MIGCRTLLLLASASALLIAMRSPADDTEPYKIDILRIACCGALNEKSTPKEKSALETLQRFIKDETGLDNEIQRHKDWREVTEKLSKGEVHLGVYQGFEFAWAQEKDPELKPLALAVNVELYPIVYVVVQKKSEVKDFAGLQGQTLSLPTTATGQRHLQLFLEHQCQASGKEIEKFFAKISNPDNIEDAVDDVVDGIVNATVLDKTALEAYKRRKPARFAKLKDIVRSQPFPPVTVAYYDKIVDERTLKRFRDGLLGANKKEQGETLLTLFRMTGFQTPPADFDKVLEESRKTYPPPEKGK
jgi:ABC-type phosphate/phosphonate transport system substrate-binding protein